MAVSSTAVAGDEQPDRPVLHELARAAGILPHYRDANGELRRIGDATREALLAAMGFDASSETAAAAALASLREHARTTMLEPVRVVRARDALTVPLRLPQGARAQRWRLEWTDENGQTRDAEGRGTSLASRRRLEIPLPDPPSAGYHELRIELDDGTSATQTLIVTPRSCLRASDVLGDWRVFGLVVNLYSVRSRRNQGAGDLTDLEQLIDRCAEAGGAFVGLNPLHALCNVPPDISPYSPTSRLFRSPLYIDVTRVPELATSAEARALLASGEWQADLERLRAADRVDYAAVMERKDAVLDVLYREFRRLHASGDTERGRAWLRFRERHGAALEDFATFVALRARFGGRGWPAWPAAFQRPDTSAVREFRRANREVIERHAWVQFELDRQLEAAAARARTAGMRIGLYMDMAIGSSWGGSDVWSFPDIFVEGASLGAPPDDYSAVGQDWALPPVHPLRLRESRYRYWILLIRNALDHAGALRIDHVMGLFRQFWIPKGMPGNAGGYVRYPDRDLLGILALESVRRRALIIGEDLGTVPPGLSQRLASWGILSSRVLYFERADRGFRPPSRYSPRALVTVNTHDHAPLAGFWTGRDLELRRELGTLPEGQYAAAREQRERERAALTRLLATAGLLPRTGPDRPAALSAAVHGLLARTPAPLLGIALDDLAVETEPVNVPGVPPDVHPSWTRRMAVPLEDLFATETAVRTLDAVRERASNVSIPGETPTRGARIASTDTTLP